MKYPPLRPIQIPKVDISTLPNGMKLYLLEDHELPLVTGTTLIRTGNLFDPADKVGLATITGTRAAHGRHEGQDRRPDRRGTGEHSGVGGEQHRRDQRHSAVLSV